MGRDYVDVAMVTVAVILEISVDSKKVVPKSGFWLWIFGSMILTAFYKTIFTTEVILPYKRTPLWRHIYDLEEHGFQFFLPLTPDKPLFYELYSNGTPLNNFLAFEFGSDIYELALYEGDFPRLLGYAKVANAFVAGDHENGWKSRDDVKPIWRELHYKRPTHLYSNLSRCEDKLAFVDKKGYVKDIIPFLNDNKDGVVFMEGADPDFLLQQHGIQINSSPRKNFVLDRVKFLMVSGIYKRWEEWFRRIRPNKLFPYYANWTRPTVEALEKLDFRSKFVTTLRIWGICCGFCVAVGIIELMYEQCHYLKKVVTYASRIMTENG
ncbi:hypothetical protein Fcan01_25736 [Folsomia candida]|uniref:Uncharacterized protein n=1 Tax=Folsomia candida TaxID=158441 RepID=A0A226D322_FOLCA|nr:hypothetical protein Fcan01_25736 [Folsomia candida]